MELSTQIPDTKIRGFLLAPLLGALVLSACGGSSNTGGGSHETVSQVVVAPLIGQTVNQGASVTVDAFVVPRGQGVTWSLAGPGELFMPTPTEVTYIAPGGISNYTPAVVTATSIDNPSVSSYAAFTAIPFNTFPNVQPMTVDGGPVPGKVIPNSAFTSVTICVPGTLNCRTIDGIQVDTGSSGLRILASALPSLPAATDGSGNSISECIQFADQSYIWGPVVSADVRIAGEVARALAIHAIADPGTPSIPRSCTAQDAGQNLGTQAALGANGILGVGLEPQDCGPLCEMGPAPPTPAYYKCSSGSCNPSFVPIANQVSHPAGFFQKDNNGVILQLPAPVATGAPLSGTLLFGIGSQTNNMPGDATVFTVDESGHFSTVLPNTGQTLTASFIDSSANGFYFPDGSLAICSGSAFFCPASNTPFAAVNVGNNNSQSTINFSVDNASNLLASNPSGATFPTLAGPNGSGSCANGKGACTFEWGLPFFYGRNVFVAIDGQQPPVLSPPPGSPPGTPPPEIPIGPWWAYTTGFTK